MVSLLIQATTAEPGARAVVYRTVMTRLREALNGDLTDLSPATQNTLRFRWPPATIMTEAWATAGSGRVAFWKRLAAILLQSALQKVMHAIGGKAGTYDAPAYKQELMANSDFRRFDDTLRLVLDCNRDQVRALDSCLADLRSGGSIAYGMHVADSALMTCVVFSLENSEHVHFIDGNDGGFAMAAQQMKAQLGT